MQETGVATGGEAGVKTAGIIEGGGVQSAVTGVVPGSMAEQRPKMLQLALDLAAQRLELNPASDDLLFEKAHLLEQLGKPGEAQALYRQLLARTPTHLGALSQLANLLFANEVLVEAGQLYLRAVRAHPEHIASRASLGNILLKSDQTAEAREQFEAALRIDPDYRAAHAGLAYVMDRLGDKERAELYRSKAYAGQCIVSLPYRGPQQPIKVLLLLATTTGNVPTHRFLSNLIFERILVATEYYQPGMPLPPHHLVFNAVGEADTSDAALAGAAAVLANTKAAVINPPSAVQGTSRRAVAERLAQVPGVITAKTELMGRADLLAPDAVQRLEERGFAFPLLLRTPGFHGGQNFVRVETGDGLAEAVRSLPGEELLVLEYLEARGADGKSRKYRVMLIGGRLYPLHAAISAHWKVHYFSADMNDSAEHRAEDAAFITDMRGVLGERAVAALEQVQTILGLDYGGIDFGVNDRGELLIFEANATMNIAVPDHDPRWDYRRPVVRGVFEAMLQMLIARATMLR
jgi:glutathione synthase/RimK-type ligase-like ATP-grasp enzyme